jgi:ectoine utilization protein EutC
MQITILTESELRSCVELNVEVLEAVEGGFTALAEGHATIPPIVRVDVHDHNGEVDIKTAYIQGLDHFAIKIASGFFDNRLLGLPTGSGMMVLINAKIGVPEAVLLDNGYLTDVRTAAAGAIAAKYLAPNELETVGVIGSGMQARYQVRALALVREFSKLLVYGLDLESVNEYTQEIGAELGIEVIPCSTPEELVRQSTLVITATPAKKPIVHAEWLHPGLHITCMGSDSEEKQEIEADVFSKVDRVVCDKKSQCFRLGELHHALLAGVFTEDEQIDELGDLTSGKAGGRYTPEEITVCDLTGVGVQDTAIALLAYERAQEMGLGHQIES